MTIILKSDLTSARISETLASQGIVVIPNYADKSFIDMITRYSSKRASLSGNRSTNFATGAYLRSRNGQTLDGGVTRLYMPHKEYRLLEQVALDKMILEGISIFFGRQAFPRVDWIQYNVNPACLTTRDFHVDVWKDDYISESTSLNSINFMKLQVKAFLYLTDVSEDDGPFCFKIKSKEHIAAINSIPPNTKQHSTDAVDVLDRISKVPTLTCSGLRGNLILADVTLFHRGLPQQPGKTRQIYSVSYYDFPGELMLDYVE